MASKYYPGRYRRQKTKDQSRKILLIVDGESERKHFEYFKGKIPGVRVKIYVTGKGGLKVGLRKSEAEIRLCDPEKDFIAYVTDVDANSPEELIDFEKQCASRKINLFVSNPSFEVWLLMHFGKVRNNLSTQEDLESELSDKLGKPYIKSVGIDVTEDGLKEALIQADSKIKGDGGCTSECLSVPLSTTIHFLVG